MTLDILKGVYFQNFSLMISSLSKMKLLIFILRIWTWWVGYFGFIRSSSHLEVSDTRGEDSSNEEANIEFLLRSRQTKIWCGLWDF